MRVYLTGFMGAGKSTVGRLLAGRLGCPFVDLDRAIEEHAGSSIPELFADLGEVGFRRLEGERLRATGELSRVVVATGGGTPVDDANRQWMHAHGTVVWLEISFERAAERLGEALDRPLWKGAREARRLYDLRLPFYRDCGLSITCGGRSASDLASEIDTALGAAGLR